MDDLTGATAARAALSSALIYDGYTATVDTNYLYVPYDSTTHDWVDSLGIDLRRGASNSIDVDSYPDWNITYVGYTVWEPSPVPLPAPVWFLGPGFIVLAGFKRKFWKA